MRVTCQQIARRLNLSAATVSRVLNHREDAFISQATRDRVLTTAREMGYQANRAARSLVTGKTQLIAFWMPTLAEPFYVGTIHHVQRQVKAQDYELIVTEMGTNHEWHPEQSHLIQWPVDGILAFNYLATEETLRQAVGVTPCVTMGPYYAPHSHYVAIDLYGGSRDAVRHLIASGRQRVAYLTLDRSCHPGDSRFDAYTDAVIEAGVPAIYLPMPGTTREIARQIIVRYFAGIPENQRPDALFCRNDDTAIGAYRGLRDLGLRIPEDVALVGCDGIQDTEYLDVPISTVRQPLDEMCALAWQFLQRAMEERDLPPQQTVLPSELVIRESSGGISQPR